MALSLQWPAYRRTLHRVTPATCSAHSRVWAQARAVRMPIITHLTSHREEYSVIKCEFFELTVTQAQV